MSILTSRILLGLSLLVMYFMNYVGSSTGLLGESMERLSVIFPFDYMPPGWMFGVSWGLIFVLLGVWYVLQWMRNLSTDAQIQSYRTERKLAILTIILNISRLIATGQERYLIAAIVIVCLMIVLAKILGHCRRTDRLWSWGGLTRGVYYGWITIATAILTVSIVAHVFAGFSPYSIALTDGWTRGVRGFGLIVVLWSYRRYRSIPALIWSLVAMGTSARAFFS